MFALGWSYLIEIGENKEAIYLHRQNLLSAAGRELSSSALCGRYSAALAVDGRSDR